MFWYIVTAVGGIVGLVLTVYRATEGQPEGTFETMIVFWVICAIGVVGKTLESKHCFDADD